MLVDRGFFSLFFPFFLWESENVEVTLEKLTLELPQNWEVQECLLNFCMSYLIFITSEDLE